MNDDCWDKLCTGDKIDWSHNIKCHFYLKKEDREEIIEILKDKVEQYE